MLSRFSLANAQRKALTNGITKMSRRLCLLRLSRITKFGNLSESRLRPEKLSGRNRQHSTQITSLRYLAIKKTDEASQDIYIGVVLREMSFHQSHCIYSTFWKWSCSDQLHFHSVFNSSLRISPLYVPYNGVRLPDIIRLTQCYYHNRGTRLNVMTRFCICSL